MYLLQNKRRNGCAKVWMRNEAAHNRLIRMKSTVLFDINGYWVAQNDAERLKLSQYAKTIQDGTTRIHPKLPRGTMVFEPLGRPQVAVGGFPLAPPKILYVR